MRFVKLVDLGNVPEISVDGLGGIELVTPNILRCQYYTCHAEDGADCENRLSVALRWDVTQWLEAWTKMSTLGPARLLNALPILDARQIAAILSPPLN